MATINPFDELGRILASGGHQRFITQAAAGVPIPILFNNISERYHQLSPNQSMIMAELVTQAATAATILTPDIVTAELAFNAAPINPVLGGDEDSGIRYQSTVISESINQDTGEIQRIRHVMKSGVVLSWEDLLKAIEDLIDELLEKYPGKFKDKFNMPEWNLTINPESIQRKY